MTNRDVCPCTASTFNLGASAPSGWTRRLDLLDASRQSGASASTTLQVTSPAAADGTLHDHGTVTNTAATIGFEPFSAVYVVDQSGGGGGGTTGTFSDNFDRANS